MQVLRSVVIEKIINLPRGIKEFIVMINDVIITTLSFAITFFLSFNNYSKIYYEEVIQYFLISTLILLFVFKVFNIYKTINRYLGLYNFRNISKCIFIFTLICSIYLFLSKSNILSVTFPIIHSFFIFLFTILSRNFASNFLIVENKQKTIRKRCLIYGAGKTGINLCNILEKVNQFQTIGFIDDNKTLHNRLINNLKIFNPHNIISLQTYYGVTDIILAMPTINKKRKLEIIEYLSSHKFNVYSLPDISQYDPSKVSLNDVKKINITDIISRSIHKPIKSMLKKNINNKVVMITGGGGSIGFELAKQTLLLNAKTVILIDMNELGLHNAKENLDKLISEKKLKTNIIHVLMSVCDIKGIENIIKKHMPDLIFHAAAYKHVPIVENNPLEGLYNNIFSTLILTKMAVKFKIKNLLLISTDKAVRPTNIMGASKRVSELIIQAYANQTNDTILSLVRFGNVIGSSGSAIPKFTEQIKNGGPVTITHPDITRFFMTVSEAAQLVIQSSSFAKGGEIFLLDMKKPIKIIDVVTNLINLLGYKIKDRLNPDGDIEIKYIGLRPGEKLYEELLINNHSIKTKHPDIYLASDPILPYGKLTKLLKELEKNIKSKNLSKSISLLKKLVPEYSKID